MTLVLAWTDSTHAYIISDSAETHWLGQPSAEVSSLGQLQRQEDGGPTVEERAQKIVELGPNAIAALIGDAAGARAFAQHFRKVAESGFGNPKGDPVVAAREISEWRGGSSPFEVVLALSVPGLPPALVGYSYPERRFFQIPQNSCVIRGSGAKAPFSEELPKYIRQLPRVPRPSPEKYLALMLSVMNREALHTDLIRYSVGGSFVGAATGDGQIIWQPDMLYALYRPDFRTLGVESGTPDLQSRAPEPPQSTAVDLVTTRVRHGHVAIASTKNTRAMVLRNGVLPPTDLSPHFSGPVDPSQYEYAALLPLMAGGRTVIIEGNDPALSPLRVSKGVTAIRSDLAAILVAPSDEVPPIVVLDRVQQEELARGPNTSDR